LPFRRIGRRQQDGGLVPPAFGRGSLLRDDPHAHGFTLGPIQERTSVPVKPDLHLTGRLAAGPHGLLLLTGGGAWELEANRRARRLLGCEVEVAGHRSGFNGLICDDIWLAGQPRPRRLKLNIDYILTGGFVGYGLIATIFAFAGYFARC
jgi:hypothetical protein